MGQGVLRVGLRFRRRTDPILELQRVHMVGDVILVPLVDAFLEQLHGLSTGRDVEDHEEAQGEANKNGNADAYLVEELVV